MVRRRARPGGRSPLSSRGNISKDDSLHLWVEAGGRCEFRGCGEYLLEDGLTGYELNLAERAHIVGATEAYGSPRGDDNLPRDERNCKANLMLLCRKHHRVIDTLLEEHGVEKLREMKREHEARIHHLTGLQDDAQTVVVRAIGSIRGGPTGVSSAAVLQATTSDRRYPYYALAFDKEDLEIDLRMLPEQASSYWDAGVDAVKAKIATLVTTDHPIRHVSVFALARIPFLVALGFYLDDKIPATIYPRRRSGSGDGDWGFVEGAPAVQFEFERVSGEPGNAAVAIVASVTASICGEIVRHNPESTIYELRPASVAPGRELLEGRASMESFSSAYHSLLGTIETDHADCKAIDLYAAVPAPGAVQLGRGLMRDAQPVLRVHDRTAQNTFAFALELRR